MITTTEDMILPTAIVGSIPRPSWYTLSLHGREFKHALTDRAYREQYIDAVGAFIHDQTRAGLDIVTDGDARFDNDVGGRGWFFYPLERLGGFEGCNDVVGRWTEFARPGDIFWELMEAYQQPTLVRKVTPGPLHYTAIWQIAQRLTTKPVKFGAISVDSMSHMIKNEAYDSYRDLLLALADIVNAEYRQLDAAGCPIIQVEEPLHHIMAGDKHPEMGNLDILTEAFNRTTEGINTEVWAHTCWGNPAQQTTKGSKSYKPSLDALFQVNADVITFECASTDGEDLEAIGKIKSDKKIGVGVISHLRTPVESPEEVAALIRKALKYIPLERLIITTDCGFGREGLSRRIAYYKMVAQVEGTNIVRGELGLPTAEVRAADPKLVFGYPG
jgi:5-methyltetrahydropteroyltriglutamate--homocysteine methyltransferase